MVDFEKWRTFKNAIKYLLFSILLMLVAGCPDATGPSGGAQEAALPGSLTLKVGEEKYVSEGDFSIRFDGVVEDSRCPVGYECLWAGNAAVALSLRIKDEWETRELNTLSEPVEMEFAGVRIRIHQLDPYPVADQEIDPDAYVVTLTLK